MKMDQWGDLFIERGGDAKIGFEKTYEYKEQQDQCEILCTFINIFLSAFHCLVVMK
jgi:hypothetical protein